MSPPIQERSHIIFHHGCRASSPGRGKLLQGPSSSRRPHHRLTFCCNLTTSRPRGNISSSEACSFSHSRLFFRSHFCFSPVSPSIIYSVARFPSFFPFPPSPFTTSTIFFPSKTKERYHPLLHCSFCCLSTDDPDILRLVSYYYIDSLPVARNSWVRPPTAARELVDPFPSSPW